MRVCRSFVAFGPAKPIRSECSPPQLLPSALKAYTARDMAHLVSPVTGPITLDITLPGSKSITLRDCLLAALAQGESTLRAPGECDDYWRMKDALRGLHIPLDDSEPGVLKVVGNCGKFASGPAELFVGQSGVTARFLLAAAALRQDETLIDADASMRVRPNKPLLDALVQLGVDVRSQRDGYLPATLCGPEKFAPRVSLRGDISSQYFSALMITGALLPQGLEIGIEGELVSRPYVRITINEMNKFGAMVDDSEPQRLLVMPGGYTGQELTVEGDASGCSYFAALATLHGGTVVFRNLGTDTKQGDYRFLEVCEKLGARVIRSPMQTTVEGHPESIGPLGGALDMEPMPDVAPTLMAMAPLIPGTTRLVGLATLRVKECDRLAAGAAELARLGVPVQEGPDWIEIGEQPPKSQWSDVSIKTYDDHRIAMSFGVLGTLRRGVTILDPDCVRKTFPNFWQELARCEST